MEAPIRRRLARRIVMRFSPMYTKYIEKEAEISNIPKTKVRESLPARRYLEKII